MFVQYFLILGGLIDSIWDLNTHVITIKTLKFYLPYELALNTVSIGILEQ